MSPAKCGAGGLAEEGALVVVALSLSATMALAVHRLSEDKERTPCLGQDKTVKMWGAPRRLPLDILMVCWGLGTWLGVNGLYVQLPLLVQKLPEEWALPASMALSVQFANIGLLIYALLHRLMPRVSDSLYIYGLLSIGSLSLLLNAFLYTETAMIGSKERSVAFLTLTFFAALVGCTSSVLFYPYLRHFRDVYLATYLVGEGLSGFLPSIIALIQGVNGKPECVPSVDNSTLIAVYPPARFDSMVFFLILAGLSAVSLVSFFGVDTFSTFKSEKVAMAAAAKDDEATTVRESLLMPKWVIILMLMAVLNALMNGVLPSIQSYSCMPYGTEAYHFAVTLGAMANPAACLAGVWMKPVPTKVLGSMLAIAVVPLSFIMATALLSPAPPLYQDVGGVILIVLAWVIVQATISYARMWIYGWARRGGARGMRACGALTQLGSAVGSLLLFVLVNYTKLFTQPEACPSPVA